MSLYFFYPNVLVGTFAEIASDYVIALGFSDDADCQTSGGRIKPQQSHKPKTQTQLRK